MDLRTLQELCYMQSRSSGWWTNLATGAPVVPEAVVPEKLMLIVTEVAEAMEGFRKHSLDDKLPHRSMLEVELADAVIRIFDLAGAMKFDMENTMLEKLAYNKTRVDHTIEHRKGVGGKSI